LPFGEAGNEYGDEENPAGPGKDKEVKTPGPAGRMPRSIILNDRIHYSTLGVGRSSISL
jgi:hypothetical protein